MACLCHKQSLNRHKGLLLKYRETRIGSGDDREKSYALLARTTIIGEDGLFCMPGSEEVRSSWKNGVVDHRIV